MTKLSSAAISQDKKEPKYYSADPVSKPRHSNRRTNKPTKLRRSLKPGQLVILLAGRFKGSRAVFLKQLPSGLLLISGPYKINGVPLRRINQSYVIATSTSIDVSKVDVSDIDDSYFKFEVKKSSKADEEYFSTEKKVVQISQERKDTQARVDLSIEAAITEPLLKEYLAQKFSLNKGQYPHRMKF